MATPGVLITPVVQGYSVLQVCSSCVWSACSPGRQLFFWARLVFLCMLVNSGCYVEMGDWVCSGGRCMSNGAGVD